MKQNFLLLLFALYAANSYAQFELTEEDVKKANNWLESTADFADEKLLAGALIAEKVKSPHLDQILYGLATIEDANAVTLSVLSYHCLSGKEASFCNDNKIYHRLIEKDSDNLEPYLYLATSLFEQSKQEESLTQLKLGLNTKKHNDFYADKITILMEELINQGYSKKYVHLPAGIYADVVTWYQVYSKLYNMCKSQSPSSVVWKETCLFLGARLQNSSSSMIANTFGGSIQRDVLIAIGADEDLIDLISERREWDNKIRDLANEKLGFLSDPEKYPETFKQDAINIPEREALLRELYRNL